MLFEEDEHVYLPYFYIDPSYQSSSLGVAVLTMLVEKAKSLKKSLRICALKGCQTTQFCLEHDFSTVSEHAYEIYYEYAYHRMHDRQGEIMV
jgi:GNAT superfamily N-acetyltransferase